MKRSTMIKILQNAIYAETMMRVDEQLAYSILQHLEEAGMLPPGRLDSKQAEDLGGWYVNEWEPEDE